LSDVCSDRREFTHTRIHTTHRDEPGDSISRRN
jgi:hypothetical protein